MVTPEYARTMARYNRWQNRSLYREAGRLSDAQRNEHRGAFFGSIHATLSHLLWADQTWIGRFGHAGAPPRAKSIADSLLAYQDWDELVAERVAFDEVIVAWAERLDAAWLAGDLTWTSVAAGRQLSRPRGMLVGHFFNHQTHHRGQVHCMLTGFGMKPDDTDLMLLDTNAP